MNRAIGILFISHSKLSHGPVQGCLLSVTLAQSGHGVLSDEQPDKNPDENPDKHPDEQSDEHPDKNPDEHPDENPDKRPDENPD